MTPAVDWPRYLTFREGFAGVMDPRLYTIAWLDGLVWSGRAQFWGGEKAAFVTEIRVYPTGAADLHFLVAAGDLDEIVNVLRPKAEAWAKNDIGCLGAIVESREAWAKVLKPHGYETHQLAVRKDL